MHPVASFTKEVNPWLAKRPLQTNGRLANLELTSLVKEATGRRQPVTEPSCSLFPIQYADLYGPLIIKR